MEPIQYKGFDIYPQSFQLRDTEKWTIEVTVMKRNVAKGFSASNTFDTEEEALKHASEFGRQIIDGKISSCSIDDLI